MPCYQRGRAVISSCVWGVIDRQSVMVCRSDGCHFERELLFYCCSLKWCPVLGKIEVPWMLYPGAVMWGGAACCCCRLASPPHKTQDVRAEQHWLVELFISSSSSTPATERLWLVSAQILLIILCVALRQAERDTRAREKFALSVWVAICLVLFSRCCVCCSRSWTQSLLISSVLLSFLSRSTGPACCRVWCSAAETSLHAISAFSRKVAGFFLAGSFAAALKLSRTLVYLKMSCGDIIKKKKSISAAAAAGFYPSSTIWSRHTRDMML